MSFLSKQPVAPTRHRSSSAVRSGALNNRPRSLGHYSTNPYNSPYTSSTPSSTFSSFNNYNGYGLNYQSPYFPNGYRGSSGSTGYASLTIPAKAFGKSDHVSRRDLSRGNSYRERSLSRSRSSLPSSSMGSRSISLTSLNSLNSEGYCVSDICFNLNRY